METIIIYGSYEYTDKGRGDLTHVVLCAEYKIGENIFRYENTYRPDAPIKDCLHDFELRLAGVKKANKHA